MITLSPLFFEDPDLPAAGSKALLQAATGNIIVESRKCRACAGELA
jgi:hypothetical protein